jgi:hypothetical protein
VMGFGFRKNGSFRGPGFGRDVKAGHGGEVFQLAVFSFQWGNPELRQGAR